MTFRLESFHETEFHFFRFPTDDETKREVKRFYRKFLSPLDNEAQKIISESGEVNANSENDALCKFLKKASLAQGYKQ